jgi:GNAT superfamily N-acetyltransferase
LRHRAWNNLQTAASRTYVVCRDGSHRIVGYFSLSMGQILAREATGSMLRNMPKFIPAVALGRLAIDRAWRGKGLGRALLADVVRRLLRASSEVSARLVIVHATSAAAEAFFFTTASRAFPSKLPRSLSIWSNSKQSQKTQARKIDESCG